MTDDVLITGSSGFIGKHIAGGKIFTGRLNDLASVREQSRDVCGIVHLAAKSDKQTCENDPRGCISTNLTGLCNILETALNMKIWVLFISTYQVKEPHLYGLSKLMAEHICLIYKQKGTNVRIVRLPIVYGAGQGKEKIVAKIIEKVKAGQEPVIETDAKFFFIYVKDVVAMIESEVSVLKGEGQVAYSIRDLVSGIKECLKEAK